MFGILCNSWKFSLRDWDTMMMSLLQNTRKPFIIIISQVSFFTTLISPQMWQVIRCLPSFMMYLKWRWFLQKQKIAFFLDERLSCSKECRGLFNSIWNVSVWRVLCNSKKWCLQLSFIVNPLIFTIVSMVEILHILTILFVVCNY